MAIKFLNTVAVDTDVLYVDASSNNVGIGTTSPNANVKLHLYNSASATDVALRLTSNANSKTLIGFGDTVDQTAGAIKYDNATSEMSFEVLNSTEAMRINSSGNVLVNKTSSTGDVFQVQGNNNIFAARLDGSTTGGQSYGLRVRAGTNSSDTSFLVENTGGTDLFLVRGDGNVGIGTTSPETKLDVIGEGAAIGTTGYYYNARFRDASNVGVIIGHNNVANGNGMIAGINKLAFLTYGTSWGERMIIDGSGNVGIGTTSPSSKLTVNGDARLANNGKLYLWNDHSINYLDYQNWVASSSAGMTIRNSAANGDILLLPNGNVGIGTTNPSEKLEVAGNARITGDVTLSNGNALRWTSDDVRIEGTTAGDNIKFYVANTEILQLAQSGTLATVTGNLRVTGAYYDSNNLPGTSGQVLSSTATGTDWVSLSEISGVDGTGTTNYVAKWSDTDTITDSVIYDNGTNVGIGTTNPAEKLHVNSGTTNEVARFESTDAAAYLSIMDNSTTGSLQGVGSVGDALTLYSNSAERVRINSSGNVGIGTTDPGSKLTINGGINNVWSYSTATTDQPGFVAANNTSFFTQTNLLYSKIYGSDITATAFGVALGNYAVVATDGSDNNGLLLGTFNAKPLIIGTNAGEKMRITSGGNVGIGTTVPLDKLHVNGRVRTSTDGVVIGDTNAVIYRNSNDLELITYGGFDINLMPSGNVGIGTTSPVKNLNLQWSSSSVDPETGEGLSGGASGKGVLLRNSNVNVGTFANLDFRANNADARIAFTHNATNNGDFHFILDNTTAVPLTRLFIEGETGNVGIGTTNPSATLELNSNTGNAAKLKIGRQNGTTNYLELGTNGGSSTINAIGIAGVYADLIFNRSTTTATSESMRILGNGNVGIGTTSPSYKLSIDDNTITTVPKTLLQFDSANIADNGGYNIDFRTSSNDTADRFVARIRGARESTGALSQLSFWTESGSALAQRMTIRASGNVGIGTTSPDAKLHVNGNIRIPNAGKIVFGTAGSPNDYLELNDVISSGKLLKLVQDGATRFDINGVNGNVYMQGNVGIGTTSPSEKLHVSGGNVLIQGGLSTTSQSELGFTNVFDTAFIRSRYTNPSATTETYLAFHTNTSGDSNNTVAEQMRIAGNKVGIGTTTPSSKLQVAGGVQMADDTDAASVDKVGTLRYRTSGNNSYVDMCMQTGATTYEWVNIVQNNW